jgi:hypothetical protein
VTPPLFVTRDRDRRRPAAPVAGAGAAAFVGTLLVPAITVLWWLLAVAIALVALAWAGAWLRGLSPEAAAARGR